MYFCSLFLLCTESVRAVMSGPPRDVIACIDRCFLRVRYAGVSFVTSIVVPWPVCPSPSAFMGSSFSLLLLFTDCCSLTVTIRSAAAAAKPRRVMRRLRRSASEPVIQLPPIHKRQLGNNRRQREDMRGGNRRISGGKAAAKIAPCANIPQFSDEN